MKILFWNIWGHRHKDGVHAYIQQIQPDVCCLTEVSSTGEWGKAPQLVYLGDHAHEPPAHTNGYELLEREFRKDYRLEYAASSQRTWVCERTGIAYEGITYGSALMLRNAIPPVIAGYQRIACGDQERPLQYVVVEGGLGEKFLIAHLHGIWLAHNRKGDDPLRDEQSRLVLMYLQKLSEDCRASHIIFGGDLNLALDTRALRALESDAPRLINLVRTNNIQSTRTPSYRKYGILGESLHADYTMVSPGIAVQNFSVDTSITASDHAPLLLTLP